MIVNKIGILQVLSPTRREANRLGKRWSQAAAENPELIADVIRMGGILELRDRTLESGVEVPEPIDPIRLAVERGRQEMAKELLGLMGLTPYELSNLIREDDYETEAY